MKITNDKPEGRSSVRSRYHDTFSQLTPDNNCLVCDDWKEANRVGQALENWAKKNSPKGCKVVTQKSYKTDGKPRCWLVWPADAIPPKTALRGNFPGTK